MKVHHVGYLVKNLKKSEKQFLTLGFSIEREAAYDEIRRVNISFLVNGDTRVELVEPADKESPLFPLLSKFKNAPYHICYETDDLEKTQREYEAMHYVTIQPAQIAPCIDGRRVVFMNSSAAGIIELLEK
ncbi:MAG: VOC family protein [Lachnospiraceae bacterium]|nr:VOC family protein [Lachnospiraceae bacterium]